MDYTGPSKMTITLIIVFLIIGILLAFVACFGVSSVANDQNTINDNVNEIEDDVKALDLAVVDLSSKTSTIEQKTKDLSYDANFSFFSQNLKVNQSLLIGEKDIGSTLEFIETQNGVTAFTDDVLMGRNLIVKDKNVYDTISQITGTSVGSTFSKNVLVTGNLDVNGVSTLKNTNITGTLTVNGKNLNSTLSPIEVDSSGNITLLNNLSVLGSTNLQETTISGKNLNQTLSSMTTDIDGNVTFSENLTISKDLILENKNINDTLSSMTTDINGNVTFSEDVNINGELTVQGINILLEIDNLTQGSIAVDNLTLINLTVSEKSILNNTDTKEIYFKSNSYNTGTEISSKASGAKGAIMAGTGNGFDLDTFNLAIYAENSIGFVNQNSTCLIGMNVLTGGITCDGLLSKNLYIQNSYKSNIKQIQDLGQGLNGLLTTGTGNGSTFDLFDLALYCNGSLGLVNPYVDGNPGCKIVFDVINGIIKSHTLDVLKNISFKNSCAGYMLTTADSYTKITGTYSILMSLTKLDPPNSDDMWIVNPGYKFVLYDSEYYAGTSTESIPDGLEPKVSLDNTNGYETNYIKLFNSGAVFSQWGIKQTRSVKVYYKGVEIKPFLNGPNGTGNPSTI